MCGDSLSDEQKAQVAEFENKARRLMQKIKSLTEPDSRSMEERMAGLKRLVFEKDDIDSQ